jgi:hypothetical protein
MNQTVVGVAALATFCAPIIYMNLHGTYIADIQFSVPTKTVTPNISIIQLEYYVPVDGVGRAFFTFHATAQKYRNNTLDLYIKPLATSTPYKQDDCCRVDDGGELSGRAQLGSPDYPLHQDEKYEFALQSNDTKVALQGTLSATVLKLADKDNWLVLALGVAASVITIADWVSRRRGTQNSKNEGVKL